MLSIGKSGGFGCRRGPSSANRSPCRLAVPEKIFALLACSIFSTAADAPPRCIRHWRRSAPHPAHRDPFPGPGLAIRILGDITPEKVEILQNVDKIYIDSLRAAGLYDQVWQAGAVLLPVKSVGVMGDERTYESCVALRAVTSTDGMTADWVHLPYEFLANVSNDIINKVKGVNRVVYDISSKPPATIEWE